MASGETSATYAVQRFWNAPIATKLTILPAKNISIDVDANSTPTDPMLIAAAIRMTGLKPIRSAKYDEAQAPKMAAPLEPPLSADCQLVSIKYEPSSSCLPNRSLNTGMLITEPEDWFSKPRTMRVQSMTPIHR